PWPASPAPHTPRRVPGSPAGPRESRSPAGRPSPTRGLGLVPSGPRRGGRDPPRHVRDPRRRATRLLPPAPPPPPRAAKRAGIHGRTPRGRRPARPWRGRAGPIVLVGGA